MNALLAIIREETGHDVALHDPVTAIGDSLALLVVVLAIEDRMRIAVDDIVFDAETVADVVREVEKAMRRSA